MWSILSCLKEVGKESFSPCLRSIVDSNQHQDAQLVEFLLELQLLKSWASDFKISRLFILLPFIQWRKLSVAFCQRCRSPFFWLFFFLLGGDLVLITIVLQVAQVVTETAKKIYELGGPDVRLSVEALKKQSWKLVRDHTGEYGEPTPLS